MERSLKGEQAIRFIILNAVVILRLSSWLKGNELVQVVEPREYKRKYYPPLWLFAIYSAFQSRNHQYKWGEQQVSTLHTC